MKGSEWSAGNCLGPGVGGLVAADLPLHAGHTSVQWKFPEVLKRRGCPHTVREFSEAAKLQFQLSESWPCLVMGRRLNRSGRCVS